MKGRDTVQHRPRPYMITEEQIREAHRMYAEGAHLIEVARVIRPRTGYSTPKSCYEGIRGGFRMLSLPTRSPADACRLDTWRGKSRSHAGAANYRWRHDLDTRLLERLYRELGTTVAVAERVGESQQTVHERLVKAGAITPRPRAKRRARSAA